MMAESGQLPPLSQLLGKKSSEEKNKSSAIPSLSELLALSCSGGAATAPHSKTKEATTLSIPPLNLPNRQTIGDDSMEAGWINKIPLSTHHTCSELSSSP